MGVELLNESKNIRRASLAGAGMRLLYVLRRITLGCKRGLEQIMISPNSSGLMADANDTTYSLRMPIALRERLMAAKTIGIGSASQAVVLRGMAELYCAFVEEMRRQPHDIAEVFAWALAKKK